MTQEDVDAQRRYGGSNRLAGRPLTEVEAIALRGLLAERVATLPPSLRLRCVERLQLREVQLAEQELKRQVAHSHRPATADARAYFEAHQESFHHPKQWRLRNMFVRIPVDASSEERVAAIDWLTAALSRVHSEEDFIELARAESDSPTAIRGGRIGFVSPSQLLPAVRTAVEQLEPGEISEIIETEDGFTVLFCSAVRPGRSFSFDDARDGIVAQLARAAFDEAWAALDQMILRRLTPLVHPDAVKHGKVDDVVLRLRTSGRATEVNRSTYLDWVSTRGPAAPLDWSAAQHREALRELALIFGRADEARRRGLACDEDFRERLSWEREDTTAECVLDFESRLAVTPPTDAEITATYHEHRSTLVQPLTRDIELMRADVRPTDPQAQFRDLRRLADAIRAGTTSFAAAAETLKSEDHSVEIEVLSGVSDSGVDALGRSIAAAVKTTGEGEVGGPIQEETQLILVRVVAIQPSRQLTLDEATPQIRRHLELARLREARRAITAEILADQEIVYH